MTVSAVRITASTAAGAAAACRAHGYARCCRMCRAGRRPTRSSSRGPRCISSWRRVRTASCASLSRHTAGAADGAWRHATRTRGIITSTIVGHAAGASTSPRRLASRTRRGYRVCNRHTRISSPRGSCRRRVAAVCVDGSRTMHWAGSADSAGGSTRPTPTGVTTRSRRWYSRGRRYCSLNTRCANSWWRALFARRWHQHPLYARFTRS